MLELYKLGSGPLYSFYSPYHLCHFEVPLSVARVVLFRDTVLAADRPKVDVIAMAKADLKAGDSLDAIGGYTTYGQCENYPVVRKQNLLPQGLAEGCVLNRDIPKDSAISYDDVVVPAGRVCDRLRAEQNNLFPA
jgi:predicted homoserine dehydrogenase-like protein